jgi:ABC-type polysaccharide/polyol phosphate export permease
METYLGSIWKFRYFWLSLVRMDLRTRYRRSVLGLGWSLLQPLTMTCVLCVVFQQWSKLPIQEYAPHVLTGLVCWNFILASAVVGCQCFFQGESYIRQCPLPLAIYPLRTVIGALFHFSMGLVVLVAAVGLLRGFPNPVALLSLLPTLAILFMLGWSLAVLCGSTNVYFQDTQHLAEVCFQILFYVTPIIWRIEDLKEHNWRWLLNSNPVVPFMSLVRKPLLYGAVPTWGEYLTAGAIAAGLFALAIGLLGRMQKKLIFHL